MKKFLIIFVASGFFIILLLSFLGSQKPNNHTSLSVAATIFPLYDLVLQVAGSDMDVIIMVPPGVSPHSFDLSVSKVRELSKAEATFAIGHGLDSWIANSRVDTPVIVVDEGIKLRKSSDGHEGGEDSALGFVDPHYWLNPENAKIIIDTIARNLSLIDPENKSSYEERAETYKTKELGGLVEKWKDQLCDLGGSKIITFHDSFAYFADYFCLNIVATFEPSPGVEPSPRDLAELHKIIKEHDIKAIFLEPQLPTDSVKQLAKDAGISIGTLDPLGGEGARDSYVNLLQYNAMTVASGLVQ
jgi:zinc transport system substrate-binding protein